LHGSRPFQGKGMRSELSPYIPWDIYTQMEMIGSMNTVKVFKSGNSQAVRLPKEFQFEVTEVYIKTVGRGLLLMPKDDPWASLLGSLDKFSEDFLEERIQPPLEARETF
jgi:antitoxin VapB